MGEPSTRVRLRVSPGANRSEIVGRYGEAWKVRIAAPPENGRANDAVVKLLATTFALSPSDVTLVSGHSTRDKVVELAGVDAAAADERLSKAGGEER